MPEAVRSYFRKRATAGSPPFQCVEVPDNVERRQYLRDAAKAFGTGAVIAVANRKSDADYFEGAGIRISEVKQ